MSKATAAPAAERATARITATARSTLCPTPARVPPTRRLRRRPRPPARAAPPNTARSCPTACSSAVYRRRCAPSPNHSLIVSIPFQYFTIPEITHHNDYKFERSNRPARRSSETSSQSMAASRRPKSSRTAPASPKGTRTFVAQRANHTFTPVISNSPLRR